MVAARSLPEPAVAGPDAALGALAARWAELVGVAPGGAPRLTTLLRRLVTVLRAEPFWPLAAREIGRELLSAAPASPDVLPSSLALLRGAGPAVLEMAGADGRRRLDTALDELAAGFAGALRDRTREEVRARRLASDPSASMLGPASDPSASMLGSASDPSASMLGPASDPSAETLHRTAYTQGPAGLAIAGLDGLVRDLNPALCRMFGLAALDQPRPISDFVHPDDLPDVLTRYRSLVVGELEETHTDMRLVRPDGLVLWTHVIASLVRDEAGVATHVIAVVENVSDRYRLPPDVRHPAGTDQLTRLPDRTHTERWLQRSFAAGEAARMGLAALDLDRFADVNDALGHAAGDQLLLAVAARLQMVAGEHLVTRTGGDEFAVVVTDPDGVCAVSHVADRVLAALATPFVVAGHALAVSASIGVAVAPTAEGCPAELMRAADVALSWAKAKGGGRRVVFDPERDAGESARFALLAGMHAGIDRAEFRLAYQPLVRLADGVAAGVEALVRWQHPTQGLLGPGRFIEPAERTGAIVPLGRWVLEEACRQAAAWRAELGAQAPYVSVNVSPVQLCEPGWVREVTGVLSATGLPPHLLQLEITEQAVLADEAAALDALVALRAAGVRLALDDFGTGYSSLAWLRRLPVHALKIDGSFIDGLRHAEPDPVDTAIVRALVELAHALDLEVTAEWVENDVQARRLGALGCDLGQGRFFGDAGPGEWVPGLLRRRLGS